MKKINNYLLIHYPLIWNTRALWMLLTNFLLHLFFFVGGMSSVRHNNFKDFYSVTDVGRGGMYLFSVLCSALVLILWCVFYLRNNAFKSFYRISKTYLAKETLLIVLLVFTSISYPLSFYWGVRVKVRSITNESLMLSEINDVNRAIVFVPYERAPYFILNNCEAKKNRPDSVDEEITVFDTTAIMNRPDAAEMRKAMRRPDAFSYANYCKRYYESHSYPNAIETAETINSSARQLLFSKNENGLRQALKRFFSVLDKYTIDYRLNSDTIVAATFADGVFSVQRLVPTDRYFYGAGTPVENPFYVDVNKLSGVFDFIDSCQHNERSAKEQQIMWTVFGYITLSLSVFLLCYRRFSRKVFLISIVGTLVWAILIGLVGAGMHGRENSMWWLLILLCIGFLIVGLALLRLRQNKTVAGIVLNWHTFLVPYVAMLLYGIVSNAYYDYEYELGNPADIERIMQRSHPIVYWVFHHAGQIFLFNLFFVLFYIALLLNIWAEQWHAVPEE